MVNNTLYITLPFHRHVHDSQMFVFPFGLCFSNLTGIPSPLNLLNKYHFSPCLIIQHLILLSSHPFYSE